MGIQIRTTFEIITPDSAEHGEAGGARLDR